MRGDAGPICPVGPDMVIQTGKTENTPKMSGSSTHRAVRPPASEKETSSVGIATSNTDNAGAAVTSTGANQGGGDNTAAPPRCDHAHILEEQAYDDFMAGRTVRTLIDKPWKEQALNRAMARANAEIIRRARQAGP